MVEQIVTPINFISPKLTMKFLGVTICSTTLSAMCYLYNTVGTVAKSNSKIVEAVAKSLPLTHIYITAYLPGLVQTLQYKVVGLN